MSGNLPIGRNYIQEATNNALPINTDFNSEVNEKSDFGAFDFGNKPTESFFDMGSTPVEQSNDPSTQRAELQKTIDTANANIAAAQDAFDKAVNDLDTAETALSDAEKLSEDNPERQQKIDDAKQAVADAKIAQAEALENQNKVEKEESQKIQNAKNELKQISNEEKQAQLKTDNPEPQFGTYRPEKIGKDGQTIYTDVEEQFNRRFNDQPPVTVNEDQTKQVLENNGFDLSNADVKIDGKNRAYIETKDGTCYRVVVDGDQAKILETKKSRIGSEYRDVNVYNTKDEVDKFKPDEKGNLNNTQIDALVKDMKEQGNTNKYLGNVDPRLKGLSPETQSKIFTELDEKPQEAGAKPLSEMPAGEETKTNDKPEPPTSESVTEKIKGGATLDDLREKYGKFNEDLESIINNLPEDILGSVIKNGNNKLAEKHGLTPKQVSDLRKEFITKIGDPNFGKSFSEFVEEKAKEINPTV